MIGHQRLKGGVSVYSDLPSALWEEIADPVVSPALSEWLTWLAWPGPPGRGLRWDGSLEW